ncbi:MAG: hypothetical protein ACK5LK_03600, partial [Chthoniobacterales bacterium]
MTRFLFILNRLVKGLEKVATVRVRENIYVAIAYVLATAVCLFIFVQVGFRFAEQTNPDSQGSDQGAYINLAREQQSAWYPYATDGTRNGFISWVAAKTNDPFSDEFFLRAKKTNILLAAFITLGLSVFFAYRLSALAAWNLTILSGFGALLGIGTFFGGEVLLYGCFFAFWVTALSFLQKPNVRSALLAGIFGAGSYLAKPSVMPALQLLCLVGAGIILLTFFSKWSRHWLNVEDWSWKKSLPLLLLIPFVFLVFVAPRAWDSWKKFETPFYNISKYTFWLDDWDSGYPYLTFFRKDRVMEVDESIRPTPQSYFARHDFAEAWERLSNGVGVRLQQFFLPEKKIKLFAPERKGEHRVLLTHRGFYLRF